MSACACAAQANPPLIFVRLYLRRRQRALAGVRRECAVSGIVSHTRLDVHVCMHAIQTPSRVGDVAAGEKVGEFAVAHEGFGHERKHRLQIGVGGGREAPDGRVFAGRDDDDRRDVRVDHRLHDDLAVAVHADAAPIGGRHSTRFAVPIAAKGGGVSDRARFFGGRAFLRGRHAAVVGAAGPANLSEQWRALGSG